MYGGFVCQFRTIGWTKNITIHMDLPIRLSQSSSPRNSPDKLTALRIFSGNRVYHEIGCTVEPFSDFDEVRREMHRYKRGKAKSGKGGKVKSRKQAIGGFWKRV